MEGSEARKPAEGKVEEVVEREAPLPTDAIGVEGRVEDFSFSLKIVAISETICALDLVCINTRIIRVSRTT
jgi:hypothetical protein